MVWMQWQSRVGTRFAPLPVVVVAVAFSMAGCRGGASAETGSVKAAFPGKRVLFLDSYDSSYAPGVETRAAYQRGIEGSGIVTTWAFLDEKHHPDSSGLAERAARIASLFDRLKPDVVVSSDDPAMSWIVAPYVNRTSAPVVFVGVNWNAPDRTPTMTGQVEMEPTMQLVEDLGKYARGRRVGVLAASTETDRKSVAVYRSVLGGDLAKVRLVQTFPEWKSAFRAMQDSVDILIVRQNGGIAEWDSAEAVRWTRAWTRIPTGSSSTQMESLVLLTYPKRNDEFGSYAAETVLRILGGARPADIPISTNRRFGVVVNVVLMRLLGIAFPAGFMENARCVPVPEGRVAFVNSYHTGYDWSDGIERGFLKAMGIADSNGKESYIRGPLELRMFRMDAKNHPDSAFQKARAAEIRRALEEWKPDAIVAADDDASKWLIVPHYRGGSVPVLFCGLNWDASVYGFPDRNVSGMVEVAPVRQLIDWLSLHARGRRLGYLGADVLSETKELGHYRKVLGLQFADGAMVKTFEEWKDAYRRLQGSVDMLILLSMVGVRGWDDSVARKFVLAESRIPTGTTTRMVHRYAMISFARVPEEQGLWAGDQVRQILAGVPVSAIGVATNVRSTIFASPRLLDRVGIHLPASFLDTVFLTDESEVR